MFGHAVEELMGKPVELLVPHAVRGKHDKLRASYFEKPEAHLIGTGRELVGLRKDGLTLPVEIGLDQITIEGKPHVVAFITDITERKRLEMEEHEQRAFAEALLDSVVAINSTLKLNEVLNRILSNVVKVIKTDAINVMMVDQVNQTAQVVAAAGHDGKLMLEPEAPYAYSDLPGIHQIIDTRLPLVVPDTASMGNWSSVSVTAWVRSYMGAPIIVGEKVIGVLNLDSAQPGTFSDTDSQRLMAFANQAAVAIHNAQLFSELENYAAILETAVNERTSELGLLKDRLQRILDNSPDPVIILDEHTRIETANPAFHTMFRADVDAMYHKPLTSLVTADSEQAVIDALSDLVVKGQVARFEVTARRTDGTTFDADMALAPIREESLTLGAVCILRDMTALKEVERLKDQFVANVSHELRTPITGLKLNFDLLNRDPARQDVYKSRLKREIDRLNDLIEDLLRLSRLDLGSTDLNLAEVDLNDLIRQHVGDRTPIAEGNGLTLEGRELAKLPSVEGDAGLLGQAISVLLTNALNYTPQGGRVTLEAVRVEQAGEPWVGVRVSDTGPGIPPDDLPQLFDRFYRGRVGRDSGKTGTGLGLAIASEIIGRHGGRVDVSSSGVPGEGAAFTLWLPAHKS